MSDILRTQTAKVLLPLPVLLVLVQINITPTDNTEDIGYHEAFSQLVTEACPES